MEHGREVFIKEEKKTLKERLKDSKDWVVNHKGEIFVASLSAAALTTYLTYQVFEGQSYDGFGDSNS